MSLVHRTVTPKMLAANRQNALKSTGPQTEQGITNTAQNIAKPLPFPSTTLATMRELGEDPEEYKALSEALCRTLDPQDAFELMLVEDLAQARWRRQRLIRAESGLAACQRRKLEIQRELKKHARGSAPERILKLHSVPEFGYAGMVDCLEKCEEMLATLEVLLDAIKLGPLSEKGLVLFRAAYGKTGEPGGGNVESSYKRYAESAKSGDPEVAEELRKAFVAAVKEEIAAYAKLRDLLRARDLETTPAMMDAQLLPAANQLEAIARYDAGLERQIENKVKLLVAWRSAKRAGAHGHPPDRPALPEHAGTAE